MSYDGVLSKMIKSSGLTLKQISENIGIDPSYLSKLQSGKQSPASDEVNIAISKTCKIDPAELLFEGYLDKAPEVIRTFIDKMMQVVRDILNRSLSPISNTDFIEQNIVRLEGMSPFEFLNMMNNYGPIPVSENIELTLDDRDFQFLTNPVFGIPVPDRSMVPIIPEGTLVNIDQLYEADDGDIAVVNTPTKKNMVRRILFVDDKIILVPANSSYPKDIYNNSEVEIVGRVRTMVVNLNA